jgi:hypothetical protein
MAITIGDMLGGIGAAFGGTAQQYAQGIRQREQQMTQRKREELQARQIAMYQDAGAAYQLLQQGDLDGIINLANDRLEILETFGDADPSDTIRNLENAIAAKAGDPIALRNLTLELTGAASAGRAMGILQAPEVRQPKGVVVNGNLVDEQTGDILYQSPAAAQSSEEFSPGITRFRNGVAVQYGRQGGVRVVDEQGRLVEGQAAEAAIQRGQVSGVSEAEQIAAGQVQGRGSSERAQSIINAGIDAASALPTVIDAINLLEEIQTGGFAGASMRAKSLFGIESGDEGELSNLLSVNVLQQLKPIFGAAFTAAEGERLERISASTGRSTDTNIRLLRRELRGIKTALENALDRALDSGDTTTAAQIENKIMQLNEFEASSQGSINTSGGNPDLLNRADAIVGGGV